MLRYDTLHGVQAASWAVSSGLQSATCMACTPSGSLLAVGGTAADGNAAVHFIDTAGDSLPWCCENAHCFTLACQLAHGMSIMLICSLSQAQQTCVHYLWQVPVLAFATMCMLV